MNSWGSAPPASRVREPSDAATPERRDDRPGPHMRSDALDPNADRHENVVLVIAEPDRRGEAAFFVAQACRGEDHHEIVKCAIGDRQRVDGRAEVNRTEVRAVVLWLNHD